VGYIGGDTNNPTYRAVCTGRTGRKPPKSLKSYDRLTYPLDPYLDAEALQVLYDPTKVSYENLLEFFFRMHDPTTGGRQGPDVGSQYRSAIFHHSPEQEAIARRVTDAAQKQWWGSKKLATQLIPAGQWWDAEEYHQLYLDNSRLTPSRNRSTADPEGEF
jgi:peptide-methionine (S)-S-oxide reductase